MPANIAQIIGLCEQIAPPELAEEWDNAGLLTGLPSTPVDAVLCALDLTEAVVNEAASLGAALIVTHHPILFRGRKNLREDDAEGRMLCALIRSGIALYAMHTNYDNACPGVNDALAATLQLTDVSAPDPAMRTGSTACGSFGAFADHAEQSLGGPIRRFGDPMRPVKRIAVLGGAGADYLPMAIEAGADVFVTGEISYHKALDAVDNGICVLEAGHAATERPGILALAAALQKALDAVQYNVRVLNSKVGLYL